MTEQARPDFSFIVGDNEQAAAQALAVGDFLKAYLLVHALVEALLRAFLRVPEGRELRFSDLVDKYRAYLKSQHYPLPEFIDELTKFNQRRNRIVHELWRKGYSFTNRHAKPAARVAVVVYGLLIDWLETFDPEITKVGFRYQ